MSETDSFIQEVTDEVRKDRMLRTWKKWGPYILGAVVVIVAGAAGWSYMQQQAAVAAAERGGALLSADAEQPDQYVALSQTLDEPARLIAELAAAAALGQAGQVADAVARYDAIAQRTAIGAEYRDLAVLQSVRLGGGGADRLDALVEGDGPYRLLALELRAGLAIEAGNAADAHADLIAILSDPEASAAVRQRAAVLLLASGGTLPETVN